MACSIPVRMDNVRAGGCSQGRAERSGAVISILCVPSIRSDLAFLTWRYIPDMTLSSPW